MLYRRLGVRVCTLHSWTWCCGVCRRHSRWAQCRRSNRWWPVPRWQQLVCHKQVGRSAGVGCLRCCPGLNSCWVAKKRENMWFLCDLLSPYSAVETQKAVQTTCLLKHIGIFIVSRGVKSHTHWEHITFQPGLVISYGSHRTTTTLPQPVAEPPVAEGCGPNHQEDVEDAEEGDDPTCSSNTVTPNTISLVNHVWIVY